MPITTPVAPTAPTAAPTVPDRGDRVNFPTQVFNAYTYLFGTFWTEFSALAANAYLNATSANEAATQTALDVISTGDAVAAAEAAAAAASATAGATLWVSGTTYAQGVCVWSPTDFKTYRRKIAGAGTTDPASDSTNWESLTGSAGIGAVSTIASAVSVALDASTAGYVSVAMTAAGKSLTEVDATSLSVGGPRRIVKNDGNYPVGYRDNSGALLASIAPGGILYATLKDNSTAAGSWSVVGNNLEPGLVSIDSTFSSTYASTVLKPFVALDDSKSLHFCKNTSGHPYVFCVDNATGAVGTPALLIASNSSVHAAFRVTASTAIVFYNTGLAAIISVSGTACTVGAYASPASTDLSAEDFSGAPKIAQLTSTLYVATFTDTGNVYAIACSVSGTTVTYGSRTAVSGVVTGTTVASSTVCYRISDTTALLLWVGTTTSSVYHVGNVVSVSGTTCTIGSAAQFLNGSNDGAPACCQLSAAKFLVMGGNTSNAQLAHLSVSGTTVTVTHNEFFIETATFSSDYATYVGNSATRYNPHLYPLSSSAALLWYFDSSGVSRAVVISESAGTLTKGNILYHSISSAGSGVSAGGAILPEGATEFVAVRKLPVGATNDASGCCLVPSRISGTDVLPGRAAVAAELGMPKAITNVVAARLTSGDYCILPAAEGGDLLVCRSSGDSVAKRGSVALPVIYSNPQYPAVAGVSSNRVVIALASRATTAGASTYQLRLINVEIAQ